MPDHNPIGQLRRRLVDLGCPAKALRRIVRETAEHYEDLQRAAHAQSLVGEQATAHAAEQLGNPVELANRHVEALRKSSWWGGAPQFVLGFSPLLIVLGSSLLYLSLNNGQLPIELNRQPVRYPLLVEWAYPAFSVAVITITIAITFFFVRQALHYGVARRWLWIIGGVLALHGLFLQIHASREIILILNQPVVLSGQQLSPGHPMFIYGIPIGTEQLALFHDDTEKGDDYEFEAMPKAHYRGQKGLTPYSSSELEEKVNLGVAEMYQRSLHGQLPLHSLHDPGWRAEDDFRDWQLARKEETGRTFTTLEVDRNDAGNLNWALRSLAPAPWPVLSYGLPGLGYGDVFQAINIACPLLIVAAMLAWQRRRRKRLLCETSLGNGQLIGVA